MNINPRNPIVALQYTRCIYDWQRRHNKAAEATNSQPPVMLLVRTISAFLIRAGDTDTYTDTHILAPLLAAAHEALNMDRGNLDGGRVSEWLDSIAELRGITP